MNDTSRLDFMLAFHKWQSDVYCCFLIIPEIITCSTETPEIIISFKRNCASRHIFVSYDRTLLLAFVCIIHGVKITVKDKVLYL